MYNTKQVLKEFNKYNEYLDIFNGIDINRLDKNDIYDLVYIQKSLHNWEKAGINNEDIRNSVSTLSKSVNTVLNVSDLDKALDRHVRKKRTDNRYRVYKWMGRELFESKCLNIDRLLPLITIFLIFTATVISWTIKTSLPFVVPLIYAIFCRENIKLKRFLYKITGQSSLNIHNRMEIAQTLYINTEVYKRLEGAIDKFWSCSGLEQIKLAVDLEIGYENSQIKWEKTRVILPYEREVIQHERNSK